MVSATFDRRKSIFSHGKVSTLVFPSIVGDLKKPLATKVNYQTIRIEHYKNIIPDANKS